MSLPNGQSGWSMPALTHANSNRSQNHLDDESAHNSTPVDGIMQVMPEASLDVEDENRRALFMELFRKTEDRVALLFRDDGSYDSDAISALWKPPPLQLVTLPPTTDHEPITEPPFKKAKRAIDEDDYDDEDGEDEEEDDGEDSTAISHNAQTLAIPRPSLVPQESMTSSVSASPVKVGDKSKGQNGSQARGKPDLEATNKLDEARQATEQAARRSFHTIYYTLENDRAAMLEQQQLEDSEKQLQAEMDHNGSSAGHGGQSASQGTLSSANLGASSLTLKHLIARIDHKRDQVLASDAELRVLMNEVRKNRSKWASEENVNQEELYEALEKVLTELKAHTEYSTPFLSRVNKRDAPDYYNCKLLPRFAQMSSNTVESHQNPHGPGHYDQKDKVFVVQVKGRLCDRSQLDLGQLPQVQPGYEPSLSTICEWHEKGG